MSVLLVIPVSAHGCHGRTGRGHHTGQAQQVQTSVSVCPFEGCSIAGRHSHSGVIYCGYAHASGFCDGVCRALCPLEDCDETGRHSHSGVAYCGYAHASGFCDSTCAVRSTRCCG